MSSSKVSKKSTVSTVSTPENVKTEVKEVKAKKTKSDVSTQPSQTTTEAKSTQPPQTTQPTTETKSTKKASKTTQPSTQPETTQQATAQQETTQQETTQQEKNKRHFKGLFLLSDGTVVQYGRYSGQKPKAAGNKACTKYYKLREHAMNKQPKVFKSPELHSSNTWTEIYDKFLGQPLPESVVFALQECTRGNENTGKKFYYTGSRSDISEAKRNERKEKAKTENKAVFIDYKHENKVRKLKVGENESAFLTLATHGLDDNDKQRVVKRRERLTSKLSRGSNSQQVASTPVAPAPAPATVTATKITKSTKATKSATQTTQVEQPVEQVSSTKKAKKETATVATPETVVVKKTTKKSDAVENTADVKKTKKTKTA